MAIVVNEVEREGSHTRGERGVRIFQVSGVSDQGAAVIAVGASFGIAPGATFPTDIALVARQPEVTGTSNLYEVRYEYLPRPDSQGTNPNERFPQIRWELGNTTEPVDYDALNRPIVNSAGDPFDPPPQKQFGTIFLTVVKQEPKFDLLKALKYQNTTNEDSFPLFDFGTVAPGQCLCHVIQPAEGYVQGDTPLKIEYRFEFRGDGFDHRLLDKGFQGYNQTAKGKIWTDDGKPISEAALLDGTGRPVLREEGPVGGNLTVEGATPTANPRPPLPPADRQTVETTGLPVTWLRYRRYPRQPFAGLL